MRQVFNSTPYSYHFLVRQPIQMWEMLLRGNRDKHTGGNVRNVGVYNEISLHSFQLRKGNSLEHNQVTRGVLHLPTDKMPLRRNHGDTRGSRALCGKPPRYYIGGECHSGKSWIFSVPYKADRQERSAISGICALRKKG